MQEVLSQQEIDTLLEEMNKGTVDPEEKKDVPDDIVKGYDFRRPNKFSREHLRTMEMIHQQFSRLLSNFLSGYLRASINVELASVAQMIYDEYMRSVPTPTVLTLFTPSPLEGSALMENNIQFALPVIDLLFGGPGTQLSEERELTDIELTVLQRLNKRVLEHFSEAWKEVYEIYPEIQNMETNPRMQQLYSANEVVALITFTVTINEESRGMINICLPFMVVEPVISKLSMRQQFQVRQDRGPTEREIRLVQHWLRESSLQLEAILGDTSITIEEFLQLQKGDTLILDQDVNKDLSLNVEGIPKFKVQPGQYNNKKAVQIVSLKERENESA